MKRGHKVLLSLLFVAIALIVVDNVSPWPSEYDDYKLAIPGIILLLGIFFTFRDKLVKSAATPTATPAAASPTPATPAAIPKKKTPSPDGFFIVLARVIVGLAIIGGATWFVGWHLIPWLDSWAAREADNPEIERKVVSPPGSFIGHNYPIQPSAKFSELAQPGTTYNVFFLEKGQHWKWDYFEAPLEYRIRLKGDEKFSSIPKSTIGQKWYAEHRGTLQIRSSTRNNRIRLIRLQTSEE